VIIFKIVLRYHTSVSILSNDNEKVNSQSNDTVDRVNINPSFVNELIAQWIIMQIEQHDSSIEQYYQHDSLYRHQRRATT